MGEYVETLASSLRGLAQFSGRSSRSRFWPYALTITVVSMFALAAVMIPIFIEIFQKMLAYADAHPEQATVSRTSTSFSISIDGAPPEVMSAFGGVAPAIGLFTVVTVVLLAAAVSRRLHDAGSSALWGLAPLPFLAFSLTMFGKLFGQDVASGGWVGLFMLVFASNLLYLLALGNLVFRLCQRSQPGDNRFGPPAV
ncbi:MAG TPA: DUF805 domain-containing protein [Hyphomonadaceae bacterium]|nr:DUF805 domain-containing protein [Hyphomonadaceae bacterium]